MSSADLVRRAPLVVVRKRSNNMRGLIRLLPAALLSGLFHTGLVGLLFLAKK